MQALYRQRGQIVQDWLTYPIQPFPIHRSTLTFRDLLKSPIYLIDEKRDGPLPPAYEMNCPGYVEGAGQNNFRHYTVERDSPRHDWYGITAPGVLIVENIQRQKTDPPRTDFNMSEVSMAIYNHRFNPNTLQYVIFAHVTNEETLFVGRGLYDLYRPSTDTQIWDYDSPEYQRFLGTRLGKLTAYMLLGAFERGSRRIARVVTWTNPSFGTPWVRFDIQVVSPCDIPRSSIEPAEPVELPETVDRAISEGPPMPMREMLPPPAMNTSFGSMTPGQTIKRQIPETHVAGYFLGVGNKPVPALRKSQGDSFDATTLDLISDHALACGRGFESRVLSEEASRYHTPTAASCFSQHEQDSTGLSELALPLTHLQIQDQSEAEIPRLVLQVPVGHVSDERTRPDWNIDIEDLESQVVTDDTGSSFSPFSLGCAGSHTGQPFNQLAGTEFTPHALCLSPTDEPTEFLTPPEHPAVPGTSVCRESRDHLGQIGESSVPQPESSAAGQAIELASVSPVIRAFPPLQLNSEPAGQREEVLLTPAPIASPVLSASPSLKPSPRSVRLAGDPLPGSPPSLVAGLARQNDDIRGSQDRQPPRTRNLWRLVLVCFRFLLDLWRRMSKIKAN